MSPVLLSSFYIFHYVFYEQINGWMDEITPIHSFVAICRAHYVDNVESEALEAVARWSVIGEVGPLVSF